MSKPYMKVENGELTYDDFETDTKPMGSSDTKYSKQELDAFDQLATELEKAKPKNDKA